MWSKEQLKENHRIENSSRAKRVRSSRKKKKKKKESYLVIDRIKLS